MLFVEVEKRRSVAHTRYNEVASNRTPHTGSDPKENSITMNYDGQL